jgi:hypothetical protein
MGRTMNNGGDVLARGGARATFRQPDVTEKKYNDAVGGFDLARFLKGEPAIQVESVKKERKRA